MNSQPSTLKPRVRRFSSGWQWAGGIGVLALFAALQTTPSLAGEQDSSAPPQAISAGAIDIYWLSGGIGDESRAEVQQSAADYNVHLMFTNRQGEFLADIPVSIATRGGQMLYSGVSDGPLLYLKLPPGIYQIAAEIDGAWQKRTVHVAKSGRPSNLRFVASQ